MSLRRLAPYLLIALPVLTGGCVTVRFQHTRAFEPITDDVLDDLRVRHPDLAGCLATLGAPNLVFEQPQDGFALAYGWLDHFAWGLDVSVSLRGLSVSADVGRSLRRMQGAVLFFDRDLHLLDVKRGLLRDFLTGKVRRRTASDSDGS